MPDLLTQGAAIFSPCRLYRYRLTRRWGDGLAHYTPGQTDHCAFQRIGKKAAGHRRDGEVWQQMPGDA